MFESRNAEVFEIGGMDLLRGQHLFQMEGTARGVVGGGFDFSELNFGGAVEEPFGEERFRDGFFGFRGFWKEDGLRGEGGLLLKLIV